MYLLEIKARPAILDNVYNWQVFQDDDDIMRFVQCTNEYDGQKIDCNALVEVVDDQETVFGNDIVQLETNEIPKGLVELEGMFSYNDSHLHQKSTTRLEELEEVNLGTESPPKLVYIGKNLAPHIKANLIKLLQKYKHVFSWSYEDLKVYRQDLFQHEIPLHPDAKTFR